MLYSKPCKRIALIICVAMLILQPLFAQKKSIKEDIVILPQIWLQFNPLNVLEPEIPIAFTGLYKKNRHWGFALDAGIFIATQNYNNDIQRYSGIRFKPELKYYLDHFEKQKIWLYLSLQGLIKYTNTHLQEFVTIQDAAGQPLFSQLANYIERKRVLGGGLNFGAEFTVDKAQRFMIDIYGGVGIREKFYKAIHLPTGASINYNTNNNNRRVLNIVHNGSFPSIAAGVKISYRIK